MSDKCEPPEELRGVDGWHYLHAECTEPQIYWWDSRKQNWGVVYVSHALRYLCPVLTPAEADALRAERDAAQMETARWRKQSNDWQKRGWELGNECDALRARVAVLEATVKLCSRQFAFYAEQHAAKGTKDGDDKMATNRRYVELCDTALSTGSETPASARGEP